MTDKARKKARKNVRRRQYEPRYKEEDAIISYLLQGGVALTEKELKTLRRVVKEKGYND